MLPLTEWALYVNKSKWQSKLVCLFNSRGSTQWKYLNAAPFCDIAPLTTELIQKHKQSSIIVVWAKMGLLR